MSNRDENALWSIFGYLLSGLLVWGGLGWLLDRLLNTHYLLLVGLIVGTGAAITIIWLRFGRE